MVPPTADSPLGRAMPTTLSSVPTSPLVVQQLQPRLGQGIPVFVVELVAVTVPLGDLLGSIG